MSVLDLPGHPAAVVRPVVRVLLVDPAERVLLVRLNLRGGPTWTLVGGGADPGEDMVTTARREVAEETGCTEFELGPELWRERFVWTGRNGVVYDSRERHLLGRCDVFTVDGSQRTELEQSLGMVDRWWTPADLTTSEERFEPADLAARVARLLRDGRQQPPPETDHGWVG